MNSRGAARGFTADVFIADEAQELSSEQMAALLPVISAGKLQNSQSIMIGTPPAPGHIGEIFSNTRDKALSDNPGRTAWHEWSVEDIGDVSDWDRVWDTNPALDIRLMRSAVESEMNTMPPDYFARERLGWWSPKVSLENGIFDEDDWNSLAIDVRDTPKDGIASFAMKFSPDGMTGCIAACRKHEDGRFHVEVVTERSLGDGLGFFVDFALRREGTAGGFAIDGGGSADVVYSQILRHDVPKAMLRKVWAQEASASCAMFADCVMMRNLTHIAQPGLDDSVKHVRKRPIGKTGYGFEGIGEYSSLPAETAALAIWACEYIDWEPDNDLMIG